MDYTRIAKKLGQRGGEKTRDTYGIDYFKDLNRKSQESKKKKKK